jgi:hypothetical protein
MPELEDQLTALAAAIDWPPTPRLRASRQFLLGQSPLPGPPRRAGRGNFRWALAAAAAFLIVATLLAYTPSREAIAGWINLHVTIHRVQNPPTPSPLPPGHLGDNLDLGTPVTLEEARGSTAWKITVPSSLGQPDAVYVKPPPSGPSQGEVTLVYAHRPDIPVSGQTGVAVLVTEARGKVNEIFFQKMLGPGSTIEQVNVGGHAGFWIAGHPHDFVFTDADGKVYGETMRLATNTLIFDNNGTIVRIEGDMTKAQALAIATSTS